MSAQAQQLLAIADDELFLGWRESEWTGIAPMLEEDVAFSSIAQNEIGHARALLPAGRRWRDGDADALAFDRPLRGVPVRSARELHVLDWAHTIARRWLYETADEIRIAALKSDSDPAVAGLAAKIDREERYHRMHAEMWRDRLRDEPRFHCRGRGAVAVRGRHAPRRAARRPLCPNRTRPPSNTLLQAKERGTHTDDLAPMWEEMTEGPAVGARRNAVVASAGLGGSSRRSPTRRSRSSRSSTWG